MADRDGLVECSRKRDETSRKPQASFDSVCVLCQELEIVNRM